MNRSEEAVSLDVAPTLVCGGVDIVRHEHRVRFGDVIPRHVVEGATLAEWAWRMRRRKGAP